MTNKQGEALRTGDRVRLKGSKKEYTVLDSPCYYSKVPGSRHRELRVMLSGGLEVLAPQIQEIVT